jgi:hypothetical protein
VVVVVVVVAAAAAVVVAVAVRKIQLRLGAVPLFFTLME